MDLDLRIPTVHCHKCKKELPNNKTIKQLKQENPDGVFSLFCGDCSDATTYQIHELFGFSKSI
jgi:ribosomal protein S26